MRGPPLGLSLNQFGLYPYIYRFISAFSRKFDSYLTYAFTDMLLLRYWFPSRIGRLMMGFGTHAQYLLKYIYQSTFTGAPRSSRILLIFLPMCKVASAMGQMYC